MTTFKTRFAAIACAAMLVVPFAMSVMHQAAQIVA